jgi:hypothetical protein
MDQPGKARNENLFFLHFPWFNGKVNSMEFQPPPQSPPNHQPEPERLFPEIGPDLRNDQLPLYE